jgi:hypothetical protein
MIEELSSLSRQNFISFLILSYLIILGTLFGGCFALHCIPSPHFITLDMSELAPVDPDLLADVLSKHPFATIDGVFNIRDLGMIPVANSEYVTRSGFMYRSGELSGVTPHGVCHSSSREFVVCVYPREQGRSNYGPLVSPPYSTCVPTPKLQSMMQQPPKLLE